MFDITKMGVYKEDHRFEAKSAKKGFPTSLWPTYSAFANTDGGIILLGAEENTDSTISITGVDEPENFVKIFWDTVNNHSKVNMNIMKEKDVYVKTIEGRTIVVIEVPRAYRQDRPIYINGNIMKGTYRRNGEGDYRCRESEIKNMIRDSCEITQDRVVLENIPINALYTKTLERYRTHFKYTRINNPWVSISDDEFLLKIGAAGRGERDGELHPTAAGLLMFGEEHEIVNEYPNFFLDYREVFGTIQERWSDRVTSFGEGSGNLYDFYFATNQRLTADLKIPFILKDGQRIDDTPTHKAIREALANALIHSDYYERCGLVIEKNRDKITFSNPGALRITHAEAISGGVSDSRNPVIMKMFAFIGIGERAGSGVANIWAVWKEMGLPEPALSEKFNPDRTTLVLRTTNDRNDGDDDITTVQCRYNDGITLNKTEKLILEMIKKNRNTTAMTISETIGVAVRTVERCLKKLRENDLIEHIGPKRSGEWRINADKLFKEVKK